MVLLIGPTTDSVVTYFLRFLKRQRFPFLFLDQGEMLKKWTIRRNSIGGWSLFFLGKEYSFSHVNGIYVRLAELGPKQSHTLHQMQRYTIHFLDVAPSLVINRPGAMSSNFSKPYQLEKISEYLPIPPYLVTNKAEDVEAFQRHHGDCIFKSVSSERSIVQPLNLFWEGRRKYLTTSPILVQPKLKGPNVRVHVVGLEVFALLIESDSLDYRYAKRFNKSIATQRVELSEDLKNRCISLTRALGLVFSGIDLIYDGPERVYCLEVNTSPAYFYFENQDFQEISNSLANCLMGNFSMERRKVWVSKK